MKNFITSRLTPDDTEPAERPAQSINAIDHELPPKKVIDAGVRRFLELAKISWPAAKHGEFVSFNYQDRGQLALVLALTYEAMRDTDAPQ